MKSYIEHQLEKNIELVNGTSIIRDLPEGIQTVLHKSGEEFREEKGVLHYCEQLFQIQILLFLDEPTAGLDPSNREIVWNMIEGLGGEVTRIVATHDVEKVILADRVVIMKEGSIVACGSPEKLINSHSFFKRCE